MGKPDPPEAGTRSFPQRPESPAAARRFAREALAGSALEHLVDTVELLVSELATNAVLHAGTEIEVSVRPVGDRVCVRVSDHRPCRGLAPRGCPPYAGTGQGLSLVEQLSWRHGIDSDENRKTVWCEVRGDGTTASPSGWRPPEPPSPVTGETVMLVDMPKTLYLASEQRRYTMLRDLTLAVSGGAELGLRPEELATARDVNNVISGCVQAALDQHPPLTDIHTLPLRVPGDVAPAAATLRRVLDLAQEAARAEQLLALPLLPRSRAFQRWLLDQITDQLHGEPPTAWTLVPQGPGVRPAELVPWDPSYLRVSRTPTIAADETNRIIAANGPVADLLGWDPNDLIGRRLTTLIPEHLRQRHIAAFTSLLLTGQARILGRSVPLPALHHEGDHIPVRLVIQTQEMPDGRTVFVAQLAPRAAVPVDGENAPERSHPAPPREAEGAPPATAPGGDDGAGESLADVSALERFTLLAGTANALANTVHLGDGLHEVGRVLTQRLADWCVIDLLGDHSEVDRACIVGCRPPPGLRPETYEGPLPALAESARGPLARVLRGAGPLLITEAPLVSPVGNPLDAEDLELFERLGTTSAIVAPLRSRREIFGALTLARTGQDRPFTEGSLSLVDDVARTLALGVDNARLYQDTRNVAERLQRSLLPRLPAVEHLQLTARYVASSTTAQVGGDWYDSFLVSGGTALVIGDVSGHNLDAAIAMSQLRSMLRGIAVDREEPPQVVLRRLDLANHSLAQEATATCLYGLVKGPAHGPWELRFSSAGHLPPLLTTADGETRFLDGGAGLLLGLDPEMPRTEASSDLPAHSTLLLYTDGLIERRDEPLDHSMARLRRHTAALARESLEVFCDELLIGLGPDSADDLAILAVRPTPPG